jgi:hypothetical protein
MRTLKTARLVALMLTLVASESFAQRSVNTGAGVSDGGFWELGVDFVGLSHRSSTGSSSTSFGFGSGSVRAGYFLTEVMSIEPSMTFSHYTSGSVTSDNVSAELGLLYHLQADKTKGQWYIRPHAIFSNSAPKTAFGVGLGFKMPSMMNKLFTVRAEGTWTNFLKDGTTPSSTRLGVLAGLSVFTK